MRIDNIDNDNNRTSQAAASSEVTASLDMLGGQDKKWLKMKFRAQTQAETVHVAVTSKLHQQSDAVSGSIKGDKKTEIVSFGKPAIFCKTDWLQE